MSNHYFRPVYDEGDVWIEESWTAHGGTHVPQHIPMEVDRCVYVDGKHVYSGPDCPHDGYNRDDPLDLEPGWTVLNIPKG